MKKEALFYSKKEERMKCQLCPHECLISNNQSGICGVRFSENDKLYTKIYGEVSSIALDPVEKKPLYHFYPGSNILSIGTLGCNMKCPYCQNWQISQQTNITTEYYSPQKIIELAKKSDSIGIAYTYSEPIVWYEYVMDCAKEAQKVGLKNIMVSNGFINQKPLEKLLPYIDAWNIDLKTFSDKTYKNVHKGGLDSVKKTIEIVYKNSHLEITTLIVTGINDNYKELIEIYKWIAKIDKNIPWHISKYYPAYNYNKPETDINLIIKIYDESKKFLNNVYCGNIYGHQKTQNSYCPNCSEILIKRNGYNVDIKNLKNDKCIMCNKKVNFVN